CAASLFLLPLHDALPILAAAWEGLAVPNRRTELAGVAAGLAALFATTLRRRKEQERSLAVSFRPIPEIPSGAPRFVKTHPRPGRSEEHTSELQSHLKLVC